MNLFFLVFKGRYPLLLGNYFLLFVFGILKFTPKTNATFWPVKKKRNFKMCVRSFDSHGRKAFIICDLP